MKPILNLNKHPKDCENLSLINAENVKLSNDLSCLQSEEILKYSTITIELNNYYEDNSYIILGNIPCNDELILFAALEDDLNSEEIKKATIFRYNIKEDSIKSVYDELNYYGGKIKGDFTYNVNNELIIAFSEYDGEEDVPLRTINLGKFDEEKEQLPNELLSINPEIYIPTLTYEYVDGNLNKGWYYIFIRYKIDNYDYTKWFSISEKILIDTLEKQNIIKYYGYNKVNNDNNILLTGVYDYFNDNSIISKESIKINLINLSNCYKSYQLGIIYNNNLENKSLRTNDISIDVVSYIFNNSNLIEYDINDMLKDIYNPLNAKNLINYKNRLYISNYKENSLKDYDTSNIKVILKNKKIQLYDLKYAIPKTGIDDENYDIEEIDNIGELDLGSANALIVKDLIYKDKTYNENISESIDLLSKNEAYNFTYEFGEYRPNLDGQPQVVMSRNFIIITSTNFKLNIKFECIAYSNYRYSAKFVYLGFDGKTYTSACGISIYNTHMAVWLIENNITPNVLVTNNINGFNIINSNESFNDRKLNNTLIPGEIYSFYIHFIDKYGFFTQGYKIQNNIKLISKNKDIGLISINEIFPNQYLIVNSDDKVFNSIGGINLDEENQTASCYGLEWEVDYDILNIDGGGYLLYEDYKLVIDYLFNKYKSLSNIKDLTWRDIPDITLLNYAFFPYKNSNGDLLFKVPNSQIKIKSDEDGVYYYEADIYNFDVIDITIPKNFIGYYISYEKYEPVSNITGLLTKFDTQIDNDRLGFITYNNKESDYMLFYSSDFDINNYINLNYNILRIESKNCFDESKNFDEIENLELTNIGNLNLPEIKGKSDIEIKYYYINNYEIIVANDYIKGNSNLGTFLKIPIIKELFNDGANIYKASLLNLNKEIYNDYDKTLIKCSNVVYPNLDNSTLKCNLNGYITYNSFLIYNYNQFIFNTSDTIVYNKNYIQYYGEGFNNQKFLNYLQIPTYKNYFYETKEFNNAPQKISFRTKEITEDDDEIKEFGLKLGSLVSPLNTIDLFKNNYENPEHLIPKIYTNYKNINYLTEFDKFVRRSDIFKDESLSNAWRNFGLENYKVISENKGKITNLVGIGIYLLVHTEHSLFAFNNDNTLQTLDKNIQLAIPDIFDIDYRELITSDLGYAGLQDSDAYIVDQFGYIFYDNDSNRLFRFDETKLDYIDTDIIQFLYKYKPNKIRFGHDKDSNRILLNIRFKDKILLENNKTLSYNYIINKFISFHNYNFNTAINTKNNLYLLDGNRTIKEFDNAIIDTKQYKYPCKLDIIINDNYNIIKQLEYIIYKLYKYNRNTHEDYVHYPVEEMKLPYSGEQIRVYNNEVDTGWLDVKIDTEESKNVFSNYDKPHWDLGNWNFNYLRNKISNKLGLDLMSKLYGNYFIISIIFGDSNERIEFESLGYNITKDKNI